MIRNNFLIRNNNWVWLLPLGYFVVMLLWVLIDPSDLRFPYPVWRELANQWKRFLSAAALLGLLWVLGKNKHVSGYISDLSVAPTRAYLVAFTLSGLVLRLLWCWYAPNQPFADGETMYREAIHLWQGKGFSLDGVNPTSYRPPGYPFLMSLLFQAVGPSLLAVKIMQAILSACVIPLLFALADRIFGRAVAIMTGLFTAFSPMVLVSSSLIMNEHLYLPLVLSALLLLLSDLQRPRPTKLVVAGLLLGASVLVRSVMIGIVFVLAAWYVYGKIPFTAVVRKTLLVAIPFVLAILPWTIRNYVSMGYPVPVCTSAGHFFGASCSDAVNPYSAGVEQCVQFQPNWRSLHPNEEVALHLGGMASAKEWIRRHPLLFMKFQAAKMVCLYGITTNWPVHDNFFSLELGPSMQPFTVRLEKMISLFYSFHFWFFLVGLVLLSRTLLGHKDEGKALLLLLFLYWAFLHGAFHAEKRYRYVIEPFVYMVSSAVAYKLLSRRTEPFAPKT